MATKTIGATGRDYATLALWAAYVNALSLSAAEVGEMYDDAEFTSATKITIGGWSGGSASNTVTLKAATGQGFDGDPLRYGSPGARLSSSTAYDNPIDLTTQHTFVQGIQFKFTSGFSGGFRKSFPNQTLRKCIVQGIGTQLVYEQSTTTTGVVENCLILNTGTAGHGYSADGGSGTLTSCTIVASGSHASGTGVRGVYTQILARNNVVVGFTTDFSGTANASSSNNATSKASFGGTNYGGSGQTSAVGSTEFESVTSGSEDYRLKSTSAKCKDNGATVGAAEDIIGTARPQGAAYDIGCWELVVAASVSIEVPAGALTLTGVVPTVLTPRLVSVPAGALSLTGVVPTVLTPRLVSVPAGALLLAGVAPTVLTPVFVEVDPGALILTGLEPDVIATAIAAGRRRRHTWPSGRLWFRAHAHDTHR